MKNKRLILLSMIIISIITIKTTNAEINSYNNIYTSISTDGLVKSNETTFETYKSTDFQFNRNIPYGIAYYNIQGDGVIIENNANAFTFPIAITDIIHNSEKLSCNTFYSTQTTFSLSYHTLYADGTTSQNDGVINENISHPTFCSAFNVNNNNDYSINVAYKLNENTKLNCLLTESNGTNVVLCPIPKTRANNNFRITQIYLTFTRNNNDNDTKVRITFPTNIMQQINLEQNIIEILNQIQNNTNTIKNDVNEIKNKMNEDISEEDKQQPSTSNFESSKQQEENIKNSISNANPNDITFNTDLTATSKIWEIVTNFLNTNSKVMGLMISILSLGVIKMILNR